VPGRALNPAPAQVLAWVLSYDGEHAPEPLAITAAGAALALSGAPAGAPHGKLLRRAGRRRHWGALARAAARWSACAHPDCPRAA
jgi:hypothetical protein